MSRRGARCHYCDAWPAKTRDHIVPRSKGGLDIAWNIVRACGRCNTAKADTMPTCGCPRCAMAVLAHREPWVRDWLSGPASGLTAYERFAMLAAIRSARTGQNRDDHAPGVADPASDQARSGGGRGDS